MRRTMAQVNVVVTMDREKGTVKFSMDLQGNTELEHEILAAAIADGRKVSIMPMHAGDELFAEFTVVDPNIWPAAERALENRIRVRDGRPTLDEEEAQAEARKKADEAAEKASEEAAAAKQAEADAAEQKQATMIANAVTAGVSAALSRGKAKDQAPAPAVPKEPAPADDAK